MRWAVLGIVLAASLAGCVGDPDVATAKALRGGAFSQATEWHKEPVLQTVMGVELSSIPTDEELETAPHWARPLLRKADVNVGDGKIQAWLYGFGAEGRNSIYFVVVGADGDVVLAEEETFGYGFDKRSRPAREPARLTDWNVDSHQAARIAKTDALWRNAIAQPGANVTWGVELDPGQAPVWWAMASAPAHEGLLLKIDGADGTLVLPEPPETRKVTKGPVAEIEQPVRQDSDVIQGHYRIAGEPVAVHQFHLGEGHPTLHVRPYIDSALLPTARLGVTLESPSGDEYDTTVRGGLERSASGDFIVVEQPQPGMWTLRMEPDLDVQMDYHIHWCAEGDPAPPESCDTH